MSNASAARFRSKHKPALLAVDGGGVRGIIPARVLVELEEVIKEVIVEVHGVSDPSSVGPVHIADFFTCISGTSVGSIIALYLALKKGGAQQALTLVQDESANIFRKTWLGWVGQLVFPLYGSQGIEDVLRRVFGDARLDDAKTSVLVPAYDTSDGGPFLFWHNAAAPAPAPALAAAGAAARPQPFSTGYTTLDRASMFYRKDQSTPGAQQGEQDRKALQAEEARLRDTYDAGGKSIKQEPERRAKQQAQLQQYGQQAQGRKKFFSKTKRWFHEPVMQSRPCHDVLVRDVVQASAAAPTFFPHKQLRVDPKEPERILVDGGVIANNPTLQALSFMHQELDLAPPKVAVLSLGTGIAVSESTFAARFGGQLLWVKRIIDVLMSGQGEALDGVVDSIYKGSGVKAGQYIRIQKIVCPRDANPRKGEDDILPYQTMSAALSALDGTAHVGALLKIGEQLAAAYRLTMKEFVREHLVAPLEDATTAASQA